MMKQKRWKEKWSFFSEIRINSVMESFLEPDKGPCPQQGLNIVSNSKYIINIINKVHIRAMVSAMKTQIHVKNWLW